MMPTSRARVQSRGLLVCVVWAILLASLAASSATVSAAPAAPTGATGGAAALPAATPIGSRDGPTDPQELGAFLDGAINAQLAAYHIPGAAVAIVKDGQLFYAQGYGFANLEQGIPVQADSTLFRVASVSKVVTSTAVMQLAGR